MFFRYSSKILGMSDRILILLKGNLIDGFGIVKETFCHFVSGLRMNKNGDPQRNFGGANGSRFLEMDEGRLSTVCLGDTFKVEAVTVARDALLACTRSSRLRELSEGVRNTQFVALGNKGRVT